MKTDRSGAKKEAAVKRIGFIGGGNMAEALIRGLLARRLFQPQQVVVSDIDPKKRRSVARRYGVATVSENLSVASLCDVVVLAVKPQHIDAVLSELERQLKCAERATEKPRTKAKRAADVGAIGRSSRLRMQAATLFISIAAGIRLAKIEAALGPGARVVRVMPNAPAMVGRGMTAVVRGSHASRADEAFAVRLFQAVGEAVVLRDESLLDAVTALSGSGPAYVYLFVKALTDAAVGEGLPRELAYRMALATVGGAQETMARTGLAPEELIRIVASPGGTTEAALGRFAAAGFSDIVTSGVAAAARRSRVLSGERKE